MDISNTTIKIQDINKPLNGKVLVAKTGDTKGRDLVVQMVDKDGKGLNMSGSRLTLAYKTPSGVSGEIVFLPENEVEGLYKLTYDAGLTHEAGVVTASIRLKTFDTVVETINFDIYVEASPLGGVLFEEIDGLTFKKVMDRVDSVEMRAELIEKDILHIDDQLQDMNTRIVYVEEDDSIDQRLYDAENDIDLLEEEASRLSGEIEAVREEIKDIEVGDGGGSGTGTTEKDTGWRVMSAYNIASVGIINIYYRRVGNLVEVYGEVQNNKNNLLSMTFERNINFNKYGLPDMFKTSEGGIDFTVNISSYRKAGTVVYQDAKSYFTMAGNVPEIRLETESGGYINGKYFTNRPFTDEYMDLPLADFN